MLWHHQLPNTWLINLKKWVSPWSKVPVWSPDSHEFGHYRSLDLSSPTLSKPPMSGILTLSCCKRLFTSFEQQTLTAVSTCNVLNSRKDRLSMISICQRHKKKDQSFHLQRSKPRTRIRETVFVLQSPSPHTLQFHSVSLGTFLRWCCTPDRQNTGMHLLSEGEEHDPNCVINIVVLWYARDREKIAN